MRRGRILAVGREAELRESASSDTEIADGEGGLALPGFHDAHLHLRSCASALSSVDCRRLTSISAIQRELRRCEPSLLPEAWLHGMRYDDTQLADGRHPDRNDLDAVSSARPIRLRHRSLHLDVLNTPALRELRLDQHASDADARTVVERDSAGRPTGRLFHSGELITRRRKARRSPNASLAHVSERLLEWGVTSVQDASPTNGPDEWASFQSASACGQFLPRLFMLAGYAGFQDLEPPRTPLVSQLQVKLMVDESRTDPSELRAAAVRVRDAGESLAIHASTESELAIALDAIEAAGPTSGSLPDRIEHGCLIPDALLPRLRDACVTVVGNPAWLVERQDIYADLHPPEQHGWLHRAQSLLAGGIAYASGSDAPVTDPNPLLGFFALRRRHLGADERLSADAALAAVTRWPAATAGLSHELGRLRRGFVADLVVLDRHPEAWRPGEPSPIRLTVVAGRVAWRR